jgi:uncharacterized protein
MALTVFLEMIHQRLADPLFMTVGLFTAGLMAFSKGAFGGGLAILGVPLLSFVMDPISAAIVVAPLICFMDMFTLRSFGPSTWSLADLVWLVPGLLIGLGVGWIFFQEVDPRIVSLAIALITLAFTAHWFLHGRLAAPSNMAVSAPVAIVAGSLSGFTTFVAHAGGPPIAMYLLRRGLDKSLYTGTTVLFFTLGNLLKLGPYLVLAQARPLTMASAVVLAPVVPISVWAGIWLHKRLDAAQLFFWCYVLLGLGALKMAYDAVRALI